VYAAARSKDSSLNASAAYDALAGNYDEQIRGDEWMRSALHRHYLRAFRPGMRVLDVACGTGTDALFLASHCIHVLAVDGSPAMVEQARKKVAAAGLTELVEARALAVADFCQLQDQFDGAISAFAGLNTADLRRFAEDAARLVHGRMVLHMLNHFSLWEWLGGVAHGSWRGPKRARTFRIGERHVPHTLYSPGEAYARYFAQSFRLRAAYSLGSLRPPHTVTRLPRPVVNTLEWIDVRAGALPGLRDSGRFFVLDLERRPT